MSNKLTQIDSVAGVSIYSVSGETIDASQKSWIFKAGAMVNADGSPNCYGPNNSGIDHTANGGTPGKNWWGGPTDSKGMPIIQKIYEPKPGMYVSGTSLINSTFPESSQYRYVNSEEIPFFVMPGTHYTGAKPGDCGLVYNMATGDNCYGIFADVGPKDKIGEISIRMAQALTINANPKTGGTSAKTIVYLLFPGSIGSWKPPNVWWDTANTMTQAWGGLARLQEIVKAL
jgi:hypothetical protein